MPKASGGMLKWLDAMFENSGLEEVEIIVGEDEVHVNVAG